MNNKLFKIVEVGYKVKSYYIYKRYRFFFITWYDKWIPNLFLSKEKAIDFLIKNLI